MATEEKISIQVIQGLEGFWLPPQIASGADNMALDASLLKTMCQWPEPVVLLRAYAWREPTLSLGVNQHDKDLESLAPPAAMPVVRRPTGGRAIWHGEDYSYAFLSNAPTLLRLSVRDSYCVISQVLQNALTQLQVTAESELSCAPETEKEKRSERVAYTRSPECFATRMPDDLVLQKTESQPQKIAGSAQCRQAGGLLQHGSLYLKSEGISFEAFTEALRQSAEQGLGSSLKVWQG